MLQDPWSKTCGIWCIYIIHQLNRGHDLKTAIHKELKGTGEDLSQNDRDIDVFFRTNQKGYNVYDSSRHFIQTKNSNIQMSA